MSDSFEIKGADGSTLAIEPGAYYFNTKARGKRMMANSLTSDARRVYACLELGTMGFQQELAVTMEGGKKRPLTSSDIVGQTGLSKQNVRRSLEELEDEGLAKRVSDDGGPLRNGHILVYSWAVPRETNSGKGSHARLPFPPWFPESWEPLKPLIKRLRLSISIDEGSARSYLLEIDEAARGYQKAEKVAIEALKRVCARAALYKEERTERTFERNGSSSSAFSKFVEEAPAETETPTTTKRPEKAKPLPKEKVGEALSRYGTTDDTAAEVLTENCQEQASDCTPEEIVHFIHEKAPLANDPKNAIGFLLKAVPRCFIGDAFARFRASPPPLLCDPKPRALDRKEAAREAKRQAELAEVYRQAMEDEEDARREREAAHALR